MDNPQFVEEFVAAGGLPFHRLGEISAMESHSLVKNSHGLGADKAHLEVPTFQSSSI